MLPAGPTRWWLVVGVVVYRFGGGGVLQGPQG